MPKKNSLRKQVAALEALAGLSELTADEARRTNGGLAVAKPKPIKVKKGTGALRAVGTGALRAPFGTGALVFRGTGALLAKPGRGA